MNELQKAELQTMKEIIKICKKYQIRYYMLGGTFLGAIRHKGFIPWDDDIDIGIPRSDYDKLVKICKEKLNQKFKIITFEDKESNANYFCKIMNTDVKVYDDGCLDDKEYYAWIDVFPLDGMPNNLMIRQVHKFRLLFHRCLWKFSDPGAIALKNSHRNFIEKIAVFFAFHTNVSKYLNKKEQLLKIDKLLRKYDFDKCKYNVNFMGAYKFKEMFPKKIYDNIKEYNFETIKLVGPNDYNFYLTQLYGNYNQVPKAEERNPHSTKVIK